MMGFRTASQRLLHEILMMAITPALNNNVSVSDVIAVLNDVILDLREIGAFISCAQHIAGKISGESHAQTK